MIVFKVFLSILNQMDFHLDQNRKENCRRDHIPFNLKGNGNIVFSVDFFSSVDIYLSLSKVIGLDSPALYYGSNLILFSGTLSARILTAPALGRHALLTMCCDALRRVKAPK